MISISIKELAAGFGNKILIRSLSLFLDKPAFIAIIGHNGAGKSTFFRAIQNEIPYSGSILINDKQPGTYKNLAAEGIIASLDQHNSINFKIPVRDLIIMGRYRMLGFLEGYSKEDHDLVEEIAEKLNIYQLLDHDFNTLSGGEQQLAWLAQLSLQNAAIYMLDEPTQHLDLYNKGQIFNIISEWVHINKKTVFCITHDLEYLRKMKGYLLNISAETQQLEEINSKNLDKNLEILEKAPKEFK